MTLISNISIDVKVLSKSQIQELLDFHNSYYGDNRIPEQWIWQYRTYNPDKVVFVVAHDDGKLIATQAMMPFYMNVGGERILTGKSENTLLLPEYRGKNIMENLYRYAIDRCKEIGMKTIWGFTPAVKAFQKFGFSTFSLPENHSRTGLNLFSCLASAFNQRGSSSLNRRLLSTAKNGFDYLRGLRYIPFERLLNTSHRVIKLPVSEKYTNDLDRLKQRHLCSINPFLDDDFINWRIKKHPLFNYSEYRVIRSDILQAYAFVAEQKHGFVTISDIASTDKYSTRLLLHSIVKEHLKKAGKFRIIVNPKYALENEMLYNLRQLGFHKDSAFNLVVQDISGDNADKFKNLANWNITEFWTEGYSF